MGLNLSGLRTCGCKIIMSLPNAGTKEGGRIIGVHGMIVRVWGVNKQREERRGGSAEIG
jgi:hypothetical protein